MIGSGVPVLRKTNPARHRFLFVSQLDRSGAAAANYCVVSQAELQMKSPDSMMFL
jgi:hypothetical protein